MARMDPIRVTLLAAALLTQTVAAVQAEGQRAPTRVRAVLPAFRTPIALDTIMQRTPLDAAPGAVWSAAAKVFYDLKISTDVRDSVSGVVGITKYNKSSFFADQAMSRLFSCGSDMTGPRADSHRINIVLVAIVTPLAAGKTELGVAFVGSAMDMRGSSNDPVACAPTGRMEALFAEKVQKILTPDLPVLKRP